MSRVSPGIMTVVIFALLAGLGGAFVVRQQLARQKPELPALPEISAPKTVYIPVAAVELEHGHTMTLGDIAILKFSPEQLAKSQYAGQSYMAQPEQLVGRTLKKPVEKGSVFSPDLLYPEGMGPGIAERLQLGYRAVTVPIENAGAVQGFARPGSIVDVLFRAKADGDRPEMTLTLLERVEVLAIKANLLPNAQVAIDRDEGTVTLAVTPQQAKVLKVVESRGELSLTLRHPDDTVDFSPIDLGGVAPDIGSVGFVDEVRGTADRGVAERSETVDTVIGSNEQVTLDDLLGLPRKAPKKQMEIYNGGQLKVVEFEVREESRYEFLLKGSRIKTPIAHEIPQPRRGAVDTVQVDANRIRTTGSVK